jgi:tungstate transport system substrate-binding protein
MTEAPAALARIAQAGFPFASRGDDSGTHRKEQALWRAAGLDPSGGAGEWRLETGSGMGATLNLAAGRGAYALTDRATWLAFGNKADLEVLVEGDPALFNQYGVIRVSPDHCPSVRAEEGRLFVDWLLSEAGQQAIAEYRLEGRQLFFPNAAE